jgi:hypothetical protein
LWDENAHINKDYGDTLHLDKLGKRKEQEGRSERRLKESMKEMQNNE